MEKQAINSLLGVDHSEMVPSKLAPKRKSTVEEAISWESGTEENKSYHILYTVGDYSVRLGKPGKEVFRDKNKNINDMTPRVFKGDAIVESIHAQFKDIFLVLEEEMKDTKTALTLLASLLYRMAFMLDHKPHGSSWRYEPPKEIIEEIVKEKPELHGMPTLLFLYYLESIALNEDVKYYTLEKNVDLKNPIGRINNILTYVYCTTVLMGEIHIADFADKLIKTRGVASLTQKDALKYFPELKPSEK